MKSIILNYSVITNYLKLGIAKIDALCKSLPLLCGSIISNTFKRGAAVKCIVPEKFNRAIEGNLLEIMAILEGVISNAGDIDLKGNRLESGGGHECTMIDGDNITAVIIPGNNDVGIESCTNSDNSISVLSEISSVCKTLCCAHRITNRASIAIKGVSTFVADLGCMLAGGTVPMIGAIIHPGRGIGVRKRIFNVTLYLRAKRAGAKAIASFTAGRLLDDFPIGPLMLAGGCVTTREESKNDNRESQKKR